MEHIQKYKIEDESLDDQPDNYIYSQNSYSNNIQTKNAIKFTNDSQPKSIKVSQPKIQISDLKINSNNKNVLINQGNKQNNPTNNKNKNSQKINNINNNKNLFNNQNQNIKTENSDINFENSEIHPDIANTNFQNIQNTEKNLEEIDLTNPINNTNENENENENINLNDVNNENYNDNDNDNAYHHVQIIDEDVENFKRRLDIMVKNFRTDTLKDFMAIKRNLLIEQKTCIENEKQKCEALLSSKGDLIEHLKDDLAKAQKSLNNQIIIKEKLVEILFKKNHDKILKKQKSLAFHGVLMKYHNKKKIKKDKIKLCRKKYWDSYKIKFFKNLKQNWKDMKIYKIVSVKEKACDDKLNEMAQYYGKEINDLRNKLNEANLIIDKSNQAKAQIQENLKKVLMRGVMAMNMEAMNVLDKDVIQKNDISAIADNIMNNVSNADGCFTTVNQGINNNNESNDNNININKTNSVNIKVGVNEDNKNLIATVIPANQSFQPNVINNNNNNSNNNNNNILLNNTNPINKDSYWLNAPSVPMDIQKNIITTENKFNREAMIMSLNNNNNLNNNILNNIETDQNNQYNENNFDDELNSRTYNLSPMNPIDTKYINSNHSLNNPNAKIPVYNNNSYYDEMQQNMLGIKSEYSMIKQNQSSMVDEDSINSYGIGKNMINNVNYTNNNKNMYNNINTTNNTSKNNNNRSNSKKGNNTGNNVNNNKKVTGKNNNASNRISKNNKKGPNNNMKNKK